jgi:hypothetical protein
MEIFFGEAPNNGESVIKTENGLNDKSMVKTMECRKHDFRILPISLSIIPPFIILFLNIVDS